MTKNRIIAVGGGLIALGTIGMVMNHGASPVALRAAGGPTVTIENPLPLPVTGGVSITGTPNVNVANTPNVNVNNTPNVHVTNSPTVQVGNSSASPVPTVATDNPARHVYGGGCAVTTAASIHTLTFCNPIPVVPPGQVLVIQTVTMQVAAGAGLVRDSSFITTEGGSQVSTPISFTVQPDGSLVATVPLVQYADANTPLFCQIETTNSAGFSCTINGYTITP